MSRNPISIHAPAWGATCYRSMLIASDYIFQSTLPRGERLCVDVCQRNNIDFNPRSRVGSDMNGVDYLADVRISIHAPAWGATCSVTLIPCMGIYFNPRSRVGSDLPNTAEQHQCARFQSTLPRGERLAKSGTRLTDTLISIHAPAWGATVLQRPSTISLTFQSTLPRGERLNTSVSMMSLSAISIHAPAWGATSGMSRISTM